MPSMTEPLSSHRSPRGQLGDPIWRVLYDARSPWLAEFTSALAGLVPTRAFTPRISTFGRFVRIDKGSSGSRKPIQFPIQRGYFSPYISRLCFEDSRIWGLVSSGEARTEDPLVCCFPHYARVAERWPGPVIYYVTDLFRAYSNWNPRHIDALERRICRRADLVCPNSTRIAEVLVMKSGCNPQRILVLPNAVREENLPPAPLLCPDPLPLEINDLPRPVAGVIGNLAENTDWNFLESVIERSPWLSWVLVGPYSSKISNPRQSQSRERLLALGGRVRFSGAKAYSELKTFARAFDVAILPYLKREPTYSGSSTRFYEHLAACRPMIATPGFEELLHKERFVTISSSANDMVSALENLRDKSFHDGHEEERWAQSLKETWTTRARSMTNELDRRIQLTN
jgi:glycosyltransferase involved in cell wall biosynthesis